MKLIQIVLIILFVSQLTAQIDEFELNSIQTQAEVDTLIDPDEIYISILTDQKDTKEALDDLEYKIKFVLKNLGINTEEQLSIDDFGSYYQSKLFKKEIKQRRKYQLKVNNAKQAISSIIALNKLDIGKIDLLKTDYSKEDELMLNLRAKAMTKAKSQAEALVSVLNQKVGKVMMIMDLDEYNVENLRQEMTGGYLVKNKKSKELELNKIRFVKRISVYFELL